MSIHIMNSSESAKFKKEVNEYIDLRIRKEAKEEKIAILEAQYQELIAQSKATTSQGKNTKIQNQPLELSANQKKVNDKQSEVLAPKINKEAHAKIGSAIDKMIAGMETNLRPKLLNQKDHENLLIKLDIILGELKACKDTHSKGTDVTKETQEFIARIQKLGAELNAHAKANANAKK